LGLLQGGVTLAEAIPTSFYFPIHDGAEYTYHDALTQKVLTLTVETQEGTTAIRFQRLGAPEIFWDYETGGHFRWTRKIKHFQTINTSAGRFLSTAFAWELQEVRWPRMQAPRAGSSD
jgi:hypothetical protein